MKKKNLTELESVNVLFSNVVSVSILEKNFSSFFHSMRPSMELFLTICQISPKQYLQGQQGKCTCSGLPSIVTRSQPERKVSQFGISFPFNTRLLHIFLTMPNRKILSAYPYMQLHHIPLNTPHPVISMKISFLLSKYRCPSVRFACGQYQTAAQAIKQ